MKRVVLAAALVMAPCLARVDQDLARIKRIYILSMGSGLDQYLANRIAERGPFEIVATPADADAVLTDRIGDSFERKLNEAFPPHEDAASSKPATSASADKDSDKGSARSSDTTPTVVVRDDRPISSFSRGRGNIFLVDRATRKVIWSTYDRPKNRTSAELNRVAGQVARRLKKAAEPPK